MTEVVTRAQADKLARYLLEEYRACLRPAVDRFRHPWVAPMPLSANGRQYLEARATGLSMLDHAHRLSGSDGFTSGDYSLGLFHHDASESAIELFEHEGFKAGAAGSLLNLLDCATPDGRVHRVELPHKSREFEPSKPVIAQYALRATRAMGVEWAEQHHVFDRALAFIRYTELEYKGLHGLFLTHSSLQSGFDSDLLTATLHDKTVEGPDTSAFMALEYDALAELSVLRGESGAEFREKAARLRETLERLCFYEDDRGGFYVALRWQHGAGALEAEIITARTASGLQHPVETWATLFPLYAGVPSKERAAKIIQRLTDPEKYWANGGVRTHPRDDVFFHQAPRVMLYDHKKNGRGPVSNWSGPIWVLSNYYLAEGCARYGRMDLARELSLKTAGMLARDLDVTGKLHECYDDEGRGLWPRGGTFLSWNILALTLLRRFAPELVS
ncbi:MAG: MGH1-like glycoside hydrolase domain-containing protein [Myxococcaceae bacterium]